MYEFALVMGWALAHMIWQAIVAGLLFVVMRGVLGPRGRHALGLGLIAALLVLAATNVSRGIVDQNVAAARPDQAGVFASQTVPEVSVVPGPSAEAAPGAMASFVGDHIHWAIALSAFWAAIALFSMVRLLGGWLVLLRIAHQGRPLPKDLSSLLDVRIQQLPRRRDVRVRMTSRMRVPTVVGVVNPTVLIPEELLRRLSHAEIEAIVVHELSHVARHDVATNLLQHVAEALLLRHPVVGWLSQQIRRDRELCCDALAARWLGHRTVLARGLAKAEFVRCGEAFPAVAATEGDLVFRIRNLVDPTECSVRRPLGLGSAALAVLLTSFLLLPLMEAPPEAAQNVVALSTEVALEGLDPISLVRGLPVVGSPRWEREYMGLRYRFASQGSRNKFDSDPTRFAAVNPKHCPIDGKDIKPDCHRVVDGRIVLFCCSNALRLPEQLIVRALTR